jgi:Xaa-Pro aminopeptidase
VAKKWWNIGIRIEDDVLVTKQGHEILTQDVPKQVSEIESLMTGG